MGKTLLILIDLELRGLLGSRFVSKSTGFGQVTHMLDEVTKEQGTWCKLLVVDVAIQGLVQSEDKFRHAANLLPKFFRIA
jgi:hypothetical protein